MCSLRFGRPPCAEVTHDELAAYAQHMTTCDHSVIIASIKYQLIYIL